MTRSCCQAYVWRGFAAEPNGYVLARLTRHSRHVWQAPRWFVAIVFTVLVLPAFALANLATWLCYGRW